PRLASRPAWRPDSTPVSAPASTPAPGPRPAPRAPARAAELWASYAYPSPVAAEEGKDIPKSIQAFEVGPDALCISARIAAPDARLRAHVDAAAGGERGDPHHHVVL